jgi:hypothetical protein
MIQNGKARCSSIQMVGLFKLAVMAIFVNYSQCTFHCFRCKLTSKLLLCYFSIKVSRQYPILVNSEFNSSYESVISQSSVVTPTINALVHAVLAIGCYNSVKGIGDNGFQRKKQANNLISIAMRERVNLLDGVPSVEKIQVRKF